MHALISGATGTIGRRLVAQLGGARVLTRDPARASARLPGAEAVAWDAAARLDERVLDGIDTVFHLAGEPVAEGRWTREKRRRILASRVDGTRAIVDVLARAPRRPA